ncbi:MAG: plasmid replication initiator protein [Mycobacteriales bacterium]
MTVLWGVERQLVERAASAGYGRWWSQAQSTGFCARPVALHRDEPAEDGAGLARVSCGNRRASVCPPCSTTYRADTWQLVAAGLRGGKGVPEQVGAHPRLFVTLTAPSFGPVHSRRSRSGRARVCRPRRRGEAARCAHGRSVSCGRVHGSDDEAVGTPLCEGCFDYAGLVVWNALLPELWRRTTIYLQRALAQSAGLTARQLRAQVRLSFTKVAEYQARGAVHLHVVLRADGVDPADREALVAPPPWCTAPLVAAAVRDVAAVVAVPAPPVPGSGVQQIGWGGQLDVREVRAASDTGNPVAVAAYVAKYATKAAEAVTAGLERPIRTLAELAERELPAHAHRLVQTCLLLHRDPVLAGLGLRRWAHMLGFGGHFSSRSRRYSVTLGALRAARAAFQQARRNRPAAPEWDHDRGAVRWRFIGQGWRSPAEELLVATAAQGRLLAMAEAREQRRLERRSLALVA